jgi:zinc/manganese transport system substrate-binding protein
MQSTDRCNRVAFQFRAAIVAFVQERAIPWGLRRWLAAALALMLLIAGCDERSGGIAEPATQGTSDKIRVVATTSIIGDWVRNIGGDQVDPTVLVGPDGDPHEYEPVPADSIALARCAIVFANGLGLETWLPKLLAGAQSSAQRVDVSSGIEPLHAGAELDPHAWQDASDAMVMAHNIATALADADPLHGPAYLARASDYINQLRTLDQYIRQRISTLPPTHRQLITTHDAFGYFAHRYGLNVSRSALESVTSEATDPSPAQIERTVEQIRSTETPAIFLENIQNPRLIEQIASEAHVKVAPPLYSDALGMPGSPGDTYLHMMRYNVDTIVAALSH